ncbi:carboxymuconolactone decarboxylase family protein [Enterovirga sp. CN4-39]|uniref:carboxymuconolactone decarboxylase family protein n=1 Tax=Enterovirga sp. CN4-39 TaxID=3400910 RepID=UPI003C0C531C
MRTVAATLLSLGLLSPAVAQSPVTPTDVQAVSPALAQYTERGLLGGVWKRPGLSARDRSVVTLAILIGKGQTVEMPFYLSLALDNGVKPAEISEIVTHLAFYSGWANATAAIPHVKDAFAKRGFDPDQLPKAVPTPLPLNEAAEATRAKNVGDNFGTTSPGLVADTTNFLFKDLWLRPDLAPRDRSLVTVSSLIANGQSAQLTSHLRIGMNNGLTKDEIGEVISHSAFYAGWPNGFSAMTTAKTVFEAQAK